MYSKKLLKFILIIFTIYFSGICLYGLIFNFPAEETLFIEKRITAEIFDDKKYYEDYILPRNVYVAKRFICNNIHEYVEICSGGELATLHEKMFTTLERNKKNDK